MPRRGRSAVSKEEKLQRRIRRKAQKRQDYNRRRRRDRVRSNLSAFIVEYAALCRKHRCYIAHIGISLSPQPYYSGKKAGVYRDKTSVERGLMDLQRQAESWWMTDM